jgi:hypothetical protein
MKASIIKYLIIGVLLIGCSTKEKAPISAVPAEQKTEISTFVSGLYIVTDFAGNKYKLVQPAYVSNGQNYVSLWQKIQPLNTNNWYTPTLSSEMKMRTHQTTEFLFNSVSK